MICQVHWFVLIEFYLPSIKLVFFPLIFISADSVANVFSDLQLFHFLKAILDPPNSLSTESRNKWVLCILCALCCALLSLVSQMVKWLPAMRETWVRSLGWEDPLEKERLPTPVSCLENSMDCSRTRLSNFHFHFQSRPPTARSITTMRAPVHWGTLSWELWRG